MSWPDMIVEYVNALVKAYPNITAKEIAERINEKFGRHYTKNAVIGKFWRDRRKANR